jgi:ethanolamine utilization microcompartment shell protein EutL
MVESQPRQRRIGIRGGSVDDVKSVILEAAKEANEVGVGLQRHQHRVGPHSPQNLSGECADSRSVLEEDSGAAPVDFRQDVVDQET